MRATFAWLASYSLSGVWRLLGRVGIRLRQGRPQLFSPDPDYEAKEAGLLAVLTEAARQPGRVVALFLDELTYYHWPLPASDWAERKSPALVAKRAAPGNKQTRIVGALNALTAQVSYRQAAKIDRRCFIRFLKQLAQEYPEAEVIYIILDNWPVHAHPEVLAAVEQLPQLQLVFLPTYSPWLNPIEKLWDWLKAEVIKMHRLAGHYPQLKQKVAEFLDLFAPGSATLLRRVGLTGNGKLARAIQSA